MKTKILYTVLLVLAIFTFSCTNEPIFYNIAQEVPLLDSVVKGNVYSIVEQGEYLYAANGKIFRKGKTQEVTNNSNPWKLVDKPAGKIIRLAATDSYLYALSVADPINGSEKYTIYVSPAGDKLSWEVVSVTENVTAIFDNEAAPGTGKLQAYYSTKDGIFAINGKTAGTTNLKTETNFISTKKETNSEEEASFAVKAATVGEITVFSDDLSFCSDREKYFYKVDEKLIKYSTDGTNWTKVSLEISDSASACYYENNGSAWLYVGTKVIKDDSSGIQAVNLNNNIPTTTVSEPVGKNIASCLDDTQVIGLYPFPYGSGNLYAASIIYNGTNAFSNDNQLWGFYPDRDSWNRE
ncbi:MAG: hypothetical protein J6K22_10825 [Spirochaetaceae bacterium]|nr:hypothetical protein [Spirochaetaceae bacterium]